MKAVLKNLPFFVAVGLLCVGINASAGEYLVKTPNQYATGKNNPEVPAECIPEYEWPPAYGAGCSNVGSVKDNSTDDDWPDDPKGPKGGKVNPVTCSDHETCTGNCRESEVCLEYGKDPKTEKTVCEKSVKVQSCNCVPKREIQDKVNYPFCHRVTNKPRYECIKTCEMPNGDLVDIKENKPRCKKFEHCCYGQSNNGSTSTDPVDTEPGDPRDQCRMKCQDVCNDKFFITRQPLPEPFQQCCTPPTPLKAACFCCSDRADRNGDYCKKFFAYFKCSPSARLNCSDPNIPAYNAPVCDPKVSIVPYPDKYDERYDPFVEFDPRFAYCGTPNSNLSCQYICRGPGVMLQLEAPKTGMWSPTGAGLDSETYENNTIKYVQGNCQKSDTGGEEEDKANPVDWPPTLIIKKETCSGQ